jgi:nitrite reductase/ring-hydroxylating ferredoxin subunit
MSALNRRQVVVGAAGIAGVAALAACSASDTAVHATTPSQSSAPGASTSDAAASGALVTTAEVPEGGGVIVSANGQAYAVTQPTKGEFKCFSAVCPHQGCNCNAVQDGQIVCPCHGSMFAIATGDVTQGPATTGLTAEKITVAGSSISLG